MQKYQRFGPCAFALIAFMALQPGAAHAQFEFQFQYGNLTNPFSENKEFTAILTLQHAAQWRFGDSFFFIDFLDDGGADGFNDKAFYGEWYPTLSIGKLVNREISLGPIRDIAVIGGVNVDGDANVLKYLPGIRASWNIPGFYFLNTDFTAVLDASSGLRRGGAPKTEDNFLFDISWGAGFMLGSQSFTFTGHAEYSSSTTNEFLPPQDVEAWILAQPQLMWDFSKAISGTGNAFFVGIEYQYWQNKLGTTVDENAVQLLLVWRL